MNGSVRLKPTHKMHYRGAVVSYLGMVVVRSLSLGGLAAPSLDQKRQAFDKVPEPVPYGIMPD